MIVNRNCNERFYINIRREIMKGGRVNVQWRGTRYCYRVKRNKSKHSMTSHNLILLLLVLTNTTSPRQHLHLVIIFAIRISRSRFVLIPKIKKQTTVILVYICSLQGSSGCYLSLKKK